MLLLWYVFLMYCLIMRRDFSSSSSGRVHLYVVCLRVKNKEGVLVGFIHEILARISDVVF